MIEVRIGPRLTTTETVVKPQNGVAAIQQPVASGPANAADRSIIQEIFRPAVRLYSCNPLPCAAFQINAKIAAKMSHMPIRVIEQMMLTMTWSLSAVETVLVTEVLKTF